MKLEPKIIKTEQQYRASLAAVKRLIAADPAPGTPHGDRLELLAKLVEDYERERFKFERPDPVEAILFRMEEQGLRRTDLASVLGGKNRVSEVLARKRPLTLSMVRALNESLRIPAELLIREPAAAPYLRVSAVRGKRPRVAPAKRSRTRAPAKRSRTNNS